MAETTCAGHVGSESSAEAKGELLRFALPRVERDLAVKIFRTGSDSK